MQRLLNVLLQSAIISISIIHLLKGVLYTMPEISLFYGIRVTMYYRDHMPPHFHAEYNGKKALIDITNIQVIKGALPNKQLRLILAWCTIHQDELMQNWELAKDMKPLNRINPLI